MTAPRPSCAPTSGASDGPAIVSTTPRRSPPPTTTASSCASAGRTKGKVESDVPYVRGRLLRGHGFTDYEQANREWESWNEEIARKRVHGTHGEVVAARAERDRSALGPLPSIPYLVVARTQRKVARDGLISFEGRRYMVPGAMIGKTVAWHTLESLESLLRGHRADGSVSKAIAKLIRADLVIVDLRRHRNYADTPCAAAVKGLLSAGFLTTFLTILSA